MNLSLMLALLMSVTFSFSTISLAQEHDMMNMPSTGKSAMKAELRPSLNAELLGSDPLSPEKNMDLILKVTDERGAPVTMDKLQVAHTKKIHLLVADESLTDYHHLHPIAGTEPGTYIAAFVPEKADNYKIWVDVTPVGGTQQFIPVLLKGKKPCPSSCVDKKVSSEGFAEGLKASVSFETPPTKGCRGHGVVKITDNAGQPINDLEPVMGAFAHIVGLYEDFSTIAHLHPMGKEPTNDIERGGPDLQFHLEPEKAGFLKLYVQIKRKGKDVFIPLGINVLSK